MKEELEQEVDNEMKEVANENKQKGKRKHIIFLGIIVALLCSTIICSILPMVGQMEHTRKATFYGIYNMSSLFDYNYALYKMLLSEKDGNYVKYDDLFQNTDLDLKSFSLDKEEEERVRTYGKTLKDNSIARLQSLEQNIKTGNQIQSLDCRIVDVKNGLFVGNLVYDSLDYSEEFLNQYAMYFLLKYNEDGKVQLVSYKDTNDALITRDCNKYGAVAYSDRYLINNIRGEDKKYYDVLVEYLSMNQIQNCTIFWGVRNDVWEENFWDDLYSDVIGFYGSYGIDVIFIVLFFLALLIGFLYRGPFKKADLMDDNNGLGWIENPPLIVSSVTGFTCLAFAFDNVCYFFANIYIRTGQSLAYSWNLPEQVYIAYALLFGEMLLYFLWIYCCGTFLANIFRMGIWNYLTHRTLTFFLFDQLRRRARKELEDIKNLDLTAPLRKKILTIIIINEIILAVITCFWFVGIIFLVIHTVVAYILVMKYVDKLQKDYQELLKATNAIAEGDLNYRIDENLGVFEPFKPEIYKIEEGFSKAVAEEVKSQKMKSELITNVSHDLKTPLTAIITYVNLLQQENLTEEDRAKYIQILDEKSFRLKGLIEDLFEVSKASSKSITLHTQPIDLVNMLKQLQLEYESKFAEKNLILRMHFSEEKLVSELDSQKTYRIYENLFSNVYKYALPGTRVFVEGVAEGNDIRITLKNISEQEIDKSPDELVGRFVRGDASRNTEGNGLGLAIVQSFTEAMGGQFVMETNGDLFIVKTMWKRVNDINDIKF